MKFNAMHNWRGMGCNAACNYGFNAFRILTRFYGHGLLSS